MANPRNVSFIERFPLLIMQTRQPIFRALTSIVKAAFPLRTGRGRLHFAKLNFLYHTANINLK